MVKQHRKRKHPDKRPLATEHKGKQNTLNPLPSPHLEAISLVRLQHWLGNRGVQRLLVRPDPLADARRRSYAFQDLPPVRGVPRATPTPSVQRQPATSETAQLGGGTYTVRKGDTLWAIAERLYGDPTYWTALHKHNPKAARKGGDLIYPGTILKIPKVDIAVSDSFTFNLDPKDERRLMPAMKPGLMIDCWMAFEGEVRFHKHARAGPVYHDKADAQNDARQAFEAFVRGFYVNEIDASEVTIRQRALGELGPARVWFRPMKARHHENQYRKVVTRSWYDAKKGHQEESYQQAITQWTRFEYRFPTQAFSVLYGDWIISGQLRFTLAAELDIQRQAARQFWTRTRKRATGR
jgi:LysM repeat protein